MARHLTLALVGLLGVACNRTTVSDVEPIVPSTIRDARTFTVSGIVFESMPDGSRRPVPDVGILRDVAYATGGGGGDSGWTSDSEGRYAIGNLPAGSRVSVVAFTGPWYQPCAATATMTADVSIEIEIARRIPPDRTLNSPPILSGIVSQIGTDGRRQPLAAREVHFMAQCRGTVLARTYTDGEGRYELCRLPSGPGCVTVNMSQWDFDFSEHRTRVSIDGSTRIDIVVPQ
jgi:hypothetical protein